MKGQCYCVPERGWKTPEVLSLSAETWGGAIVLRPDSDLSPVAVPDATTPKEPNKPLGISCMDSESGRLFCAGSAVPKASRDFHLHWGSHKQLAAEDEDRK